MRPFTDKQIELVDDLRRPSGDRDRERAAVRRGAGAYARAERGARAADRDLRDAQVISGSPGDLQPVFDSHAGKCDADLRGAVRCFCCGSTASSSISAGCHGLSVKDSKSFQRMLPRPPGAATAPSRAILHRRRSANPRRAHGRASATGRPEPRTGRRLRELSWPCRCFKDDDPIGAIVIYRTRCATVHRTSRSSWCRTSLSRPSSPSRTCGCSTSCANRCSSRPPPPTCSRSSAARPSISGGAANAGRIGGAAVRRRQGRHHPARGRRVLLAPSPTASRPNSSNS